MVNITVSQDGIKDDVKFVRAVCKTNNVKSTQALIDLFNEGNLTYNGVKGYYRFGIYTKASNGKYQVGFYNYNLPIETYGVKIDLVRLVQPYFLDAVYQSYAQKVPLALAVKEVVPYLNALFNKITLSQLGLDTVTVQSLFVYKKVGLLKPLFGDMIEATTLLNHTVYLVKYNKLNLFYHSVASKLVVINEQTSEASIYKNVDRGYNVLLDIFEGKYRVNRGEEIFNGTCLPQKDGNAFTSKLRAKGLNPTVYSATMKRTARNLGLK